jgi:predicted permease
MRSPKSSPSLPHGVRRLFSLPESRDRYLREADEEVRVHLELRAAELQASGLDEAAAYAEALRLFGDSDEYRAYSERRATRKSRWRRVIDMLEEWTQDLHFATRQFRKHPGFTALALLTLALGIGANTAIFTVVHRLLISPLPYPGGNQIVMLAMEHDDHSRSAVSVEAVRAWNARAHSFESIGIVGVDGILVQDAEEQDTIRAFITPSYLQVLGVRPVVGRALTDADVRPGAPPVAMITYGLWERAYAGRADVVGSKLSSDGTTYTIVGVTPPEMGIPMALPTRNAKLHEATPSIWLPVAFDSAGGDVFARLRPGVSAAQASKELQSIIDSDPSLQSNTHTMGVPGAGHCCARAVRAQDLVDPREARAVQVLFVAVGVLLLIACANVANLLMSRAWTRRREFAVRAALGAGRARIARLVLTESVTLAVGAGVLGVAVAWQLLRLILALRPPALANLDGVHLEPSVLLWSVAISVVTGILFGTAPALLAGTGFAGDLLRREARTSAGDRTSRRLRAVLIVGEIALSLVLLAGAGLLVRSFVALERTPLGFDPRGLVSFDILLPLRKMNLDQRLAFEKTILERFRGTPGVTGAAIGTLPGEPYHAFGQVLTAGPDLSPSARSISSGFGTNFVTPDYFRVTHMSLEGRAPDDPFGGAQAREAGIMQPSAGTAAPTTEDVVVSREMARQLWPGEPAIGRQITSSGRRGVDGHYRVVGIVDDVRIPGRNAPIEPQLYERPVPAEVPIVARVSGSPSDAVPILRHVIAETDPRVVAQIAIIGDEFIRDALAPTRFAMALLGAFSLIALVLSSAGLYGVIAYSVTQRTREIGVRVALGAAPRNIMRLVVGNGLGLAGAGVAIGLVGALAATRALRGLLYGVTPGDPVTLGGIALLVGAIAVLASYVPARRALRIDPTEALRAD